MPVSRAIEAAKASAVEIAPAKSIIEPKIFFPFPPRPRPILNVEFHSVAAHSANDFGT